MISPLTLWRSVPLFAIPSVAMAIVLYWSIPVADRARVPLLWNVLLQSGILLAALGAFAVTEATRQRWPGTSARERLRLAPCRRTDLAIGLLVGGIGLWSYLQLQFTVPWLQGGHEMVRDVAAGAVFVTLSSEAICDVTA